MLLRLSPASMCFVLSAALLSVPLVAQSVPSPTIPGEPFAASAEQLRAASVAVPVDPHHVAQMA